MIGSNLFEVSVRDVRAPSGEGLTRLKSMIKKQGKKPYYISVYEKVVRFLRKKHFDKGSE